MAGFTHSKVSVFKMDIPSGSSEHTLSLGDISAYITGVDGIPGEQELAEITALGDSGRKFFGDVITNARIGLDMMWNSDVSSSGSGGPNALEDWFGDNLSNAGSTATRSFEYSPDSTGSGKRKITGECRIASLVETSRLGEMVLMRAELQVDGAITIGSH